MQKAGRSGTVYTHTFGCLVCGVKIPCKSAREEKTRGDVHMKVKHPEQNGSRTFVLPPKHHTGEQPSVGNSFSVKENEDGTKSIVYHIPRGDVNRVTRKMDANAHGQDS
jgi:hypothetical protein